MPNEIDLTTVETAAAVLGVSAGKARLPRLITAASKVIAQHVGYELHKRTGVTETAAGQGGPFLFLRAGAIQSITSISIGGMVVPASEYRLDSSVMGRIIRNQGTWPFTGTATGGIDSTPLDAHDDGTISVTFDAGHVTPGQNAIDNAQSATLPADIEQACLEQVTAMYRRAGRDPDIQSMSLGGGSFSYGEKAVVPSTVRQLLAPYRKLTSRTF